MPHRTHRFALNVELMPSAEGAAPTWVELIPAGPDVVGRDGRRWTFDPAAADAVLAAFAQRGIDLLIDWEHASETRAPNGLEAPAAGWTQQLELRDGNALWGRVEWTPRAAQQIADREYRFLSPVFEYEPATGRIVRLVSAALTNKPNLPLKALNQENPSVSLSAALAAALGLATDATDEAAVAAVNQLKATATAANREQTPSLDKYVPRADYDQVLARATNAEQALAERKRADHKAAVDAAIDAALKAGKIAPASADYYRATCAEQDGLERFKAFVATAPGIADPSGLDGRKPAGTATALNAEEQAVARAFGMSAEDYAKAKSA
ncbi:Mu-like prophage I protein [Mizugakiibacter sediminis]|uniref:Mu-like prophage I protein n=1 Tax=Mizugakiibacter sediminis TaxID=1475481 RepID=A0A0K8QNJ4_9GAMM|nr:phage protease [Mizugakiibacter sediminis]GAP66271.1 Mu-like prophage I protein [Mizugakiibacter sediminis]